MPGAYDNPARPQRDRLRRGWAGRPGLAPGAARPRAPGSHLVVEPARQPERPGVAGRMDETAGERPSRSQPVTVSSQGCQPAAVETAAAGEAFFGVLARVHGYRWSGLPGTGPTELRARDRIGRSRSAALMPLPPDSAPRAPDAPLNTLARPWRCRYHWRPTCWRTITDR